MNGPVAIYLPSLRGGGAERVMMMLANGFSARGLKVDLVLAANEGPYLDDVSKAVRIVDLHSSRVLTSLPRLVRYLRHDRPVAVLSALNHANVIAVAACQLARIPIRTIVSEHNHLSSSAANATSLRERWVLHFMRVAYPRADGVVAVSAGVADDLATVIGIPRERVGVISNPVFSSELIAWADKAPNHPWFAPGAPPVVLGVGRLTKQKDFPMLIRAFAQLRKRRPTRLIILGEGELRAELEALVCELRLETEIALSGFVDNPVAWMRRSALFVLSSAWEGFGNVLVEAMACGVPVVSTDCPSGPAEILENGRWGRLVPVGDASALAEAMMATLDDTHRPDVMHRARDFSVDRAVEGYLRVLEIQHD